MAISSSRVNQNQGGNLMQNMAGEVIDLYKHFENLTQTKRQVDIMERTQKAKQMGPILENLIQKRGGTYAFLRSSEEAPVLLGQYIMETTGLNANQVVGTVKGIMNLDPTQQDMAWMIFNKAATDPKAAEMAANLANRTNYSYLEGERIREVGGNPAQQIGELNSLYEQMYTKINGVPMPPKESTATTETPVVSKGDERARGTTVSGGAHEVKEEIEAHTMQKAGEASGARYAAMAQAQGVEPEPDKPIVIEGADQKSFEDQEAERLLGLAEQETNPKASAELTAMAKLYREGKFTSESDFLSAAMKVPELKPLAEKVNKALATAQGGNDPMVKTFYRDYYAGKPISKKRLEVATDRQGSRLAKENSEMINNFYNNIVVPHFGDVDYMRQAFPELAAAADKGTEIILRERQLRANESQAQLMWEQFAYQKMLQEMQLQVENQKAALVQQGGLLGTETLQAWGNSYMDVIKQMVAEGWDEKKMQEFLEANPALLGIEKAVEKGLSPLGIRVNELERRSALFGLWQSKVQRYEANFIGDESQGGVSSPSLGGGHTEESAGLANSYLGW